MYDKMKIFKIIFVFKPITIILSLSTIETVHRQNNVWIDVIIIIFYCQ